MTAPPETAAPAAQADPETAPAAAPSGPLAQLLAPIQPARPAAVLGTTAAMSQDAADSAGRDTGRAPARDGARDGGQEGPVSALVRAIANRIGRTGTTTSVKRTHTISENRVAGNSTNTTNAHKTDRSARHDSGSHHRSNRDAKIHDLNNKVNRRHARTGSDVKKAATSDAKTADTKNTKADTSAKNHRDSRDVKASDTKTAKSDTSAKSSTADKNRTVRPWEKPLGKDQGGPSDKPKTPKPNSPDTPDTAKAGEDKTGKQQANPDTPKTDKTKPTEKTSPTDGPQRLRTQRAREAGYRDGTRAATVVGHVQAWRDGARDGYDDRTAADQAERKKMDDAKARNAARPQPDPKMAPASGSTADLAKNTNPPAQPAPASPARSTDPVPAQVTAVGEKAIQFAAGAEQRTMSRGEVRTLKQFERRMAVKRNTLGQIAAGSKTTCATAVKHAAQAQRLTEQARTVKGGASLVSVLLRLSERAQVLRGKAEEIEKKAHRGTEAVRVLAANAETRHGRIYKAVVDSPLTSPAEREFYQDKQGS